MLLFKGLAVIVTAVSVVYPGLMSIRAIESKETSDDTFWLTYWMIFGALDVAETFLPFIFYCIPYWGLLRPLFFLWLIKFNGANTLYEQGMKPALTTYRPHIEEFMRRFSEGAQEAAAVAK